MKKCVVVSLSLLVSLFFAVKSTYGHGVIGKRFIPTTLVVDDPFAFGRIGSLQSPLGKPG